MGGWADGRMGGWADGCVRGILVHRVPFLKAFSKKCHCHGPQLKQGLGLRAVLLVGLARGASEPLVLMSKTA